MSHDQENLDREQAKRWIFQTVELHWAAVVAPYYSWWCDEKTLSGAIQRGRRYKGRFPRKTCAPLWLSNETWAHIWSLDVRISIHLGCSTFVRFWNWERADDDFQRQKTTLMWIIGKQQHEVNKNNGIHVKSCKRNMSIWREINFIALKSINLRCALEKCLFFPHFYS